MVERTLFDMAGYGMSSLLEYVRVLKDGHQKVITLCRNTQIMKKTGIKVSISC